MEENMKRAFGMLLKLVVFAAVLLCVCFAGLCLWKKLSVVHTEKRSAVVMNVLERCAELVTVKNSYSDVISIKKTRIAGLARSYCIVKFTGEITGGIRNLAAAEIAVGADGNSVAVVLPPPEILSNGITSVEVFDEEKSVFVSVSSAEVFDEVAANVGFAEQRVIDEGFLNEAHEQAAAVLREMLLAAGFSHVDVK